MRKSFDDAVEADLYFQRQRQLAKDWHEKQVTKLDQEREAALRHLKQQYEQEIEKLQQITDAQKQQLKHDFHIEKEKLTALYANNKSAKKSSSEATLKQRQEQIEQQRDKLLQMKWEQEQQLFACYIEQRGNAAALRLARLHYMEQLEKIMEPIEDELEALEEQWAEATYERTELLDDILVDLESTYEEQLEELEARLEDELEALEEAMDEEEDRLYERLCDDELALERVYDKKDEKLYDKYAAKLELIEQEEEELGWLD